jgi:LPXTG-motif cell wall-anchored protein
VDSLLVFDDPSKGLEMKFASRSIGAIASFTSLFTLTVALPASAAVTGEWGVFGDSLTFDAQVDFANPGFPDAQIEVTNENEYGYYSPDGEGEGFTAADPVGSLVGANQSSTADNFLKVDTYDERAVTVTIYFDSPVPAGQLVIAISDIDSDRTEIQMFGESDGAISATDVIGTATTLGFNWADPSNTDDIPLVDGLLGNTVRMYDANWDTEGSTGWVRPSADVSEISIETFTEDGFVSSQRIWIGQVIEDSSGDDLASTGASDSLYLAAVAGGATLLAGGFLRLRRRDT